MEDFDEALLAEAEANDAREPSPSPPAPSPPPELAAPPAPAAAELKQSTLTFGTLQPSSYLPALNEAQRKAVTAPSTGSLQILAGPGSGKTKVLTTRVAYLLQHYKLDPEELVVVTFTNKAANEMKVRLAVIVGAATVDKLMMGTFHSVCVRYLRKYGKLIGLANNFIIADRDDCLAIIKRCVISTSMTDDLRKDLKPNTLLDVISKCKSSEMSPSAYRAQQAAMDNPQSAERMEAIWRVYVDYEAELAKDNALDFDDLLLRGLHLLQRFPRVVSKVKNVLIDEFQDTNGTQYSLVKLIAKACQSLTIVGDPDQSIYGWRNADVENLEKMVNDFAPVQQIYLEENYRSTGAILGAALAVVRQDTRRINKGLKATHSAGSSVVLHCAPNAFDEASFIAAQIKHLVAHGGGLIDYGDVAILLRYGALSRVIEVALQKSGIPSRMVGGHKFFDRAEVKDVLSYLQLVDNPAYTAAFTRIINTPKRGIGEKTTREMLNIAKKKGWTAWDVAVKLAKGSGVVGVTSTQRKGVREFVKVVSEMRAAAEEGKSVPDLIDFLCEKVAYKAFLEKTQGPDAEERWMNVEELKAYATVVAEENPEGLVDEAESDFGDMEEVELPSAPAVAEVDEDDDDYLEIIEDSPAEGFPPVPSSQPAQSTNALRTFLAVSMLATDTETQDAKADKLERKVTLSTVHAAKGLEWAVVFVPACENGTFPFYRSESPNEIDEERRLLYVAITRAQGFCTLSHSMTRMMGATVSKKDPSPFLSTVSKTYPTLFVKRLQKIGPATRVEMARVLGRPAPSEEVASQLIQEYTDTLPEDPPTYEYIPPSDSQNGGFPRSQGGFSNGRVSGGSYQSWGGSNSSKSSGGMGQWSNNRAPAAIPAGAAPGFSSALSTLRATTPDQAHSIPYAAVKRQARNSPAADQSRLSFARPAPALPPLPPLPSVDNNAEIDDDPYAPLVSRPAPPRRRPSQNGFKLPRPSGTAAAPFPTAARRDTVAPAPNRPAGPTSTSTRLPFSRPRMNPPPPTGPPLHPQGLPDVPETRHSKISDAVLLNPKVGEGVPSDLLERWSSKEQKRLTEIRGLGEGMEGVGGSAGTSGEKGKVGVVDLTGGDGLGHRRAGEKERGSGEGSGKRLSEGGLEEVVGEPRKKRKEL